MHEDWQFYDGSNNKLLHTN